MGIITSLLILAGGVHGYASEPEFKVDGPVLTLKITRDIQSGNCQKWIHAVTDDAPGMPISTPPNEKNWSQVWKEWEPWSEKDLDCVKDCDDLPCSVKLNRTEIDKMAAGTPETRPQIYQTQILGRAMGYDKTQIRGEYEFPGKLTDPWELIEKEKLQPSLPLPKKPNYRIRKLDFAPGKMQTVREILDRRVAQSQLSASTWIRDVYTDHYFDGWGEWTGISCKTANSGIVLNQVLFIELDLLKKTDFFSKIMRGKMKTAVEENGKVYLDQAFERIKTKADPQSADPGKVSNSS